MTRIEINEYAELNIKFKDHYSVPEFISLLEYLNQTSKMIKKDFLVDSVENEEKKEEKSPDMYFKNGRMKRSYAHTLKKNHTPRRRTARREFANTKEKAIKIIRLHYFGTKEKKLQFAKDNDTDWNQLVKSMHNLRKRFDIQPREVGLKGFPKTRGSSATKEIEHLRL